MLSTYDIEIRQTSAGWWTATQEQGFHQLPLSVAEPRKNRQELIQSVKIRRRQGWISEQARIVVFFESGAVVEITD